MNNPSQKNSGTKTTNTVSGKRIMVLDNYDSFTYNLVHYLEKYTDGKVDVFRNDEISLDDVNQYDKIVLSPGPGLPEEKQLLLPLIRKYAPVKSILGVCLGHQAIVQAFGGSLKNLDSVYHGVASKMKITDPSEPLFREIPDEIMVGRYHSWIVDRSDLPSCFNITIEDENGIVMGVHHKEYDVRSVQFHPESVLTEYGEKMIENWLRS